MCVCGRGGREGGGKEGGVSTCECVCVCVGGGGSINLWMCVWEGGEYQPVNVCVGEREKQEGGAT